MALPIIYRSGVHRPLTAGIQQVVFRDPAKITGFFDDETVQAVKDFQASYFPPEECDAEVGEKTLAILLPYMSADIKVLEVIAFFETGNVRNVWAYSGDCGDGNGMNYGVLQVNRSMGSVQQISALYKPAGVNFESWIGTPDGAIAQIKYYLGNHVRLARNFMVEVWGIDPADDPRAFGLLAEGAVQGGGVYPNYPIRSENMNRFWPDGETMAAWRAAVLACYDGLVDDFSAYEDGFDSPAAKEFRKKVRDAFAKSLQSAKELGISNVVAHSELYPRSGVPKWLGDQLQRRRFWANGSGVVHGDVYNLADFGL